MESAVVSLVVEKLGGMLIDKINEEASLVLSFRNEFKWLRKKLTYISGYLREADVQGAHDKSVKSWLLEVADIALDAEDILDECSVQYPGTAYIDDETPQSSSSCFCAFNFRQLGFRHKMARRIKDVKDRLRSILRDGKELQLFRDLAARPDQPSTSSTLQDFNLRGINRMEIGSKPVAIEPKVDEVLRLLDDPAAPVIAVIGMGGVGKTFLMQNVFDRIKDRFDKSVWLSISQTYSIRKLQADIASEIQLNEVTFGQVSEVQAAKLIHDRLGSKRCLVVLDDVWRADEEYNTLAKLISALGIPLMGSNTGHCKVVLTTRSRDLGAGLDARVYELHPLSEEESWKLFCAFAFPDCYQNQPPRDLEGIARQVEGECGRLPLAVRVVAASLAGDRSSTKWESKLRQLKAVVSYREDSIMQILKLSYDSLPAHLKPCFAYLSFFLEDEEIEYQYLINLWVAEGFVPQGEDQLDVGWSYICHLQSLCLVERVGDIYEHQYKMFKVHDLLLDLAISISKESQCVFSAEEALKKDPTVQGSSRYRRISMAKKGIADGDVNVLASNRAYSASRLRTLSFSKNEGIQNIPAVLLSSARVLRVLDLSGTHISSLPDCVGNLKLLRCLSLRKTKISEVPECVKNNKSLLFLDISFCRNLERLPEWIGELSCLQHLHIRQERGTKFNIFMLDGISKLMPLHVLGSVDEITVEENGRFLRLDHFVNLVNLREVQICIRHVAELNSIEDGILATLVKMRTLSIYNLVLCQYLPPLSESMLAMKDLEYLFLCKFAVPNWIYRFSHLKQLILWECHCIEYPALEMMPNLITLALARDMICKALPRGFGRPGGFPQLRYFEILHFGVLEELPELEDGAMPHLEILRVEFCYDLKKVPAGLELLKSLKQCYFFATRAKDMLKTGSEVWNKMKAKNPNVRIG